MHLSFSAEQIVVVVSLAVGGANKFASLRRGRGEGEAGGGCFCLVTHNPPWKKK